MEGCINKGYYSRGNLLCKSELETVKIEDFPEIEIYDPDETCPYVDAHDFLMGSCQLFAVELNRKFGYPIYAIILKGQMIHCFCQVRRDETTYYIDVRGVTNNYSDFLLETKVLDDSNFVIQEYTVDSFDEWDEIGLKFAQLLIEKNPEYYEI